MARCIQRFSRQTPPWHEVCIDSADKRHLGTEHTSIQQTNAILARCIHRFSRQTPPWHRTCPSSAGTPPGVDVPWNCLTTRGLHKKHTPQPLTSPRPVCLGAPCMHLRLYVVHTTPCQLRACPWPHARMRPGVEPVQLRGNRRPRARTPSGVEPVQLRGNRGPRARMRPGVDRVNCAHVLSRTRECGRV